MTECVVIPSLAAPGRGRHTQGVTMSKRARKRRSRKGKAANHGKKPNA
nr:hypothetical protein [Janibacter anophelis]